MKKIITISFFVFLVFNLKAQDIKLHQMDSIIHRDSLIYVAAQDSLFHWQTWYSDTSDFHRLHRRWAYIQTKYMDERYARWDYKISIKKQSDSVVYKGRWYPSSLFPNKNNLRVCDSLDAIYDIKEDPKIYSREEMKTMKNLKGKHFSDTTIVLMNYMNDQRVIVYGEINMIENVYMSLSGLNIQKQTLYYLLDGRELIMTNKNYLEIKQ